jgi:hypothetical protein
MRVISAIYPEKSSLDLTPVPDWNEWKILHRVPNATMEKKKKNLKYFDKCTKQSVFLRPVCPVCSKVCNTGPITLVETRDLMDGWMDGWPHHVCSDEDVDGEVSDFCKAACHWVKRASGIGKETLNQISRDSIRIRYVRTRKSASLSQQL